MYSMIDTTNKKGALNPEYPAQRLNAEDREQLDDLAIDIEDSWKVIKSYFKQHGLVSQQISSFDRFLEKSIQEIVKEHQDNRINCTPQYRPGNSRSFLKF